MADAKVVDLYAPAGIQLNYRAVTGYSHAVIMPHSLILKAIERGCVVRELKDDGSFIELTKDNYSSSNGGTEVPEGATIPIDEEDIDLEAQKNKRNEYLEEVKKELNPDEDPEEDLEDDMGGEKLTIASTYSNQSSKTKQTSSELKSTLSVNKVSSTSTINSTTKVETKKVSNDLDSDVDVKEEKTSVLKTNLSYTNSKSKK